MSERHMLRIFDAAVTLAQAEASIIKWWDTMGRGDGIVGDDYNL